MTDLLNPGDTFPNLDLTQVGGEVLHLPSHFDGRWGVVILNRGSWCPFCNQQLRGFQRLLDTLDGLNAGVVSLSVDDEATTESLIEKHHLTFPIGHSADADKIAALTGAFVNADPHYLQATGFVLDPDGRVIVSVYSSGAIGRVTAEDAVGLIRYAQERSRLKPRHPWSIRTQDFPTMTDHTGSVEPVPRRLRGYLDGACVFDTVSARYVWDSPKYPAYYVPLGDVDPQLLTDDEHPRRLRRGPTTTYSLGRGDARRPGAVRAYTHEAEPSVAGLTRIEWNALDAWFEEDEQVWVHPRNPYTRVDALRSSRLVRVELAGRLLAESSATVMVFETGLPTRYYFDRPAVDFGVLSPSDTVTECPYKGRTTAYWSARVGDEEVPDVAWSYDFPTRALSPIANLVAFYNEHTQITVDGQPASSAATTHQ